MLKRFDSLPTSVEINGKDYAINSDFRISVAFEDILADKSLSKEQALYEGLNLYYPIMPDDIVQALEKMLWFYLCGEDFNPQTEKKSNRKRIYSSSYDFKYIYAGFVQQYGIDLYTDELHWWKYRALLFGLSDCMFEKILGYRSMDLKKLPVEERKRYKKLQKTFALPEDMSIDADDIEFEKGLEEALLSGDVASFLEKNKR